MKISDLKSILEISWSKETCVPSLSNEWNIENPCIGQCAITALVINDFCGGKIMRCMAYNGSHYYNLINNEIVDLTVNQFNGIIPDYKFGEERTREYLLSNMDTKNRYLMLLKHVKDNFILYGYNNFYIKDGVLFDSDETAIKAGYRPCTKCMKKKYLELKDDDINKK